MNAGYISRSELIIIASTKSNTCIRLFLKHQSRIFSTGIWLTRLIIAAGKSLACLKIKRHEEAIPVSLSEITPLISGLYWLESGRQTDKMSEEVHCLLISIEQGLLSVLRPIALQRLVDKSMFGLDCAKFKNWPTVLSCISSAGVSKIERFLTLSVITILSPLRSSDIALSIFTVKFILFTSISIIKINIIFSKCFY